MAKIKKAAFSGGEVDPALYDSTDAKDWGLGLKTARNVLLGRNGRVLNSQGNWLLKSFAGPTKVVAVEPDGYVMVFWYDESISDIRVSAANIHDFVKFSDLTGTPTFFDFGSGIDYNTSDLTKLHAKVVKEFDDKVYVYVCHDSLGSAVQKFRFDGLFITRTFVEIENVPRADGVNITVNNFTDLAGLSDVYTYPNASAYVIADANVALRGWYKRNTANTTWVQQTVDTLADLTAGNYPITKAAFDALVGAPVQYGITLVFDNGEESTINPIITYRPAGSINTAEYTAFSKLPTVGNSLTYNFNNIYFTNDEYDGLLQSARIYRRPVVAGGTFGQVTGAGAWGYVGEATVSMQAVNEGVTFSVNFTDFGVVADFANQPPFFSKDLETIYASTIPGHTHFISASNIFEYGSRLVYVKDDIVAFSAIGFPNRFLRDFPTDDVNSFILKVGTSKPRVSGITERNGLFIYTNQGVWAGVNPVTSQADPRIRKIGDWIVDTDVPPVQTIWGDFFVDKTTNDLRRITYSNDEDEFFGVSVSDLAAHIFRNKKIVSMAFMSGETPYLCCILSDGSAANLYYDDKTKIFGWTRKEHDHGNYISVTSYHHLATGNVVLIHSVEEDGVTYLEVESLRETFNDISNDFKNFVTFGNRSKMIPYGEPLEGVTFFFNELKRNNVEDWATELVIEGVDSGAQVGKYFKAFNDDLTESCLLYYDRVNENNYPIFKIVENALPESMREKNVLIARAITEVTGLEYLEGKFVSVIADGEVMSSPYNPEYPTLEVIDGKITLPKHSCHIIVGLPYVSDIETLAIDVNRQGLSITDAKLVNRVFVKYAQSRGGYVSGELPVEDTVEGMDSAEVWNYQDQINKVKQPQDVRKEYRNMSAWKYNGSIGIRQVDPLPLQVTSITLDLVGG